MQIRENRKKLRGDSFLLRIEPFCCAAVLAAHAKSDASGFRQRDVRFLLELFTNWVERTLGNRPTAISNTQIFRFLEDLVSESVIKVNRKPKQPIYELTRFGILEIAGRMIERSETRHSEQFFFLYYFIRSYRPIIFELVERDGRKFPPAVRIELEALLDHRELLVREIKWTEAEIVKLQKRISDALKGAEIAKRMRSQGSPQSDIYVELEKKHPYELNSQKPLRSLLAEMPSELARFELEIGNINRANFIWEPSMVLLRAYLDALRKLRTSSPKC